MREWSADRPDVTENPITLDAGHLRDHGRFPWTAIHRMAATGVGVDHSVTVGLTRNLQLDGGINLGLPSHGSSYTLFSGLSVRY